MNHDTARSRATSSSSPHRVARTVAEAFSMFDDELNLEPPVRAQAHDRYQRVRDVLLAARIAVATFLQGSFARKTMLPPLKDVDMVVLLPQATRNALGHRNGPAQAMALLRNALIPAFPDVRFDVDDAPAKALRVTFRDLPFTFDLVVAFDSPLREEWVLIGNRETGEWEPSNSRVLNRLITTRNVQTQGVWVHQARMFKSFKADHAVLGEHCGLLYETLLYGAVTKKVTHPEALLLALDRAAAVTRGIVFDPSGENDLTAKWTPGQRAATVDAFVEAAKQAREAVDLARHGDQREAVEAWSELLGSPFPQAAAHDAATVLRRLNGGFITSTGAVAASSGRQPARPTRSWRSH